MNDSQADNASQGTCLVKMFFFIQRILKGSGKNRGISEDRFTT
jgi:hypothetical protein